MPDDLDKESHAGGSEDHIVADTATSSGLPRAEDAVAADVNPERGVQTPDEVKSPTYEQEANPTTDDLASEPDPETQGLLAQTPGDDKAEELRRYEKYGLWVGYTSLVYSLTVAGICFTGAVALDSSTLLATALEAAADAVGDSLVVWRFSSSDQDDAHLKEVYDEMVSPLFLIELTMIFS